MNDTDVHYALPGSVTTLCGRDRYDDDTGSTTETEGAGTATCPQCRTAAPDEPLPDRPLDLTAAKRWTSLCGSCDAGLPMTCTCPEDDPRQVIADLVAEVERLRDERAVRAVLADEQQH